MSHEPRKMVLKFAPTGKVSVEVENIKGSGCGDFTRRMETALGVKTHDMEKPEYYEVEPQSETATN